MKKWFFNINVGKRFLASFILLAIVWVGCISYTSYNYKRINDSTQELYDNGTLLVSEMSLMATNCQKIYAYMTEIIAENDIQKINSYEAAINQEMAQLGERVTDFDKKVKNVDKIKKSDEYKTFAASLEGIYKLSGEIIPLAKENRDAEAAYLINTEGRPVLIAGIDAINQLTELTAKYAKETLDESDKQIKSARVTLVVVCMIGFVIAITMLSATSIMIIRGTRKIRGTIAEISGGNLDARVDYIYKDEIGQISESLNTFANNLQVYVLGAMEKIGNGEVDFTVDSMGEKDQIAPVLNHTLESINEVIEETNMLTEAAVEGQLSVRGNAEKFNGGYKEIISGINGTLDQIINPINESVAVLDKMAVGELTYRVTGNYKGDHAKIANAVNTTCQIVQEAMAEISNVLSKVAKAEINIDTVSALPGDLSVVSDSLNEIIDGLNDIMSKISDASEQVSSGSGQIADTSVMLSQGSEEQASSIEEVTSAITQMSAQVQENASNASQADSLSVTAKDSAIKGNEEMQKMLLAMHDINESSTNISKIIKVIDDIAFQTNILALNAAVEAARAGQHGKGFAVVADEVRNLAQKSAEAAKETTAMIESSIDKVKFGTDIANNTEQALKEIVTSITKSTELVGEIASASNEQASAISQVSQAIEQVSEVTQTNSATAEETASASEELSSQAEMLKNLVGMFKLRDIYATKAPAMGDVRFGDNKDHTPKAKAAVNPDFKAQIVLDDEF